MTTQNAPLDRGFVDAAAPFLRALLGLGFVAFSANSTIFIGASHLLWLFPGTRRILIGGFADAYWYASAVALGLFIGQMVTSERYPRAYPLFLWPDVFYTVLGIFADLSIAMGALVFAAMGLDYREAAEWIGWVLAIPLSITVGYFVARWGEVLLFGRRRRTRKETRDGACCDPCTLVDLCDHVRRRWRAGAADHPDRRCVALVKGAAILAAIRS